MALVVEVAAVLLVPLPQEPEVGAVLLVLLPVLLLEVVVDLAHPAHKLLPLVLLQVAAEQEVAAVVSVEGLVASESLRNR